MNWIEKMIAEQCPNGVEKVKLGKVCSFNRGRTITSKDAVGGDVPVIAGGLIPSYFHNEYNRCGETITVAGSGANAGFVAYWDIPIFLSDAFSVDTSDNLLTKYAYYYLKNNQNKIYSTQKGAGVPHVHGKDIANFEIPLPPLSIQKEIVSVLDKFSELIEKTDEEIALRQKQYEYYREKLLTFEEGEAQALKDIINHSCSGSTPTKSVSAYYQGGTIPWLRTQDVKFNEIYEIDSYITEYAVEKTAVKWIPENCVIVAISGATAGRCAINKIKTTTNQHCLNLEIDNKKADYKYVFYCVMNQYDDLIAMKQGARGDLNSSSILKLKIPVPSLVRQQKIVATLDKFETLILKLKEERELRQKQYEYYREKLLTF